MPNRREIEIPRNNFMFGIGIGLLAVGTITVGLLLAHQIDPQLIMNLDIKSLKALTFNGSFNLLTGAFSTIRLPFMPKNGSESNLALSFPDFLPQLDRRIKVGLGILAGAIVGATNSL